MAGPALSSSSSFALPHRTGLVVVGHEDPVRRVRGRGGHGGVLRRRGRAVRALRRRDPRRQQARQQAPAPPARGALRQAPPLRRLPGTLITHVQQRMHKLAACGGDMR